MPLAASCPRCASPIEVEAVEFSCAVHGVVDPLWRAESIDYSTFAEVLTRARGMPTFLPWPMSPGWSVSGFGCVVTPDGAGLATATTTSGTSELDGEVEVTIVAEEPGVGLGARIAATDHDPGLSVGLGSPSVRLRVDSRPVPMWAMPSGDGDDLLARSVFVGEAHGRWLWLVMRPAPAVLLLRDDWLLADAGGFGPEAVEVPFGGPAPSW